jgi:dTDP-4-amino-4,6-dideoxygalactose transaminase
MTIPIMKPRLPDFTQIAAYLERIQTSQIYSNQGPLIQEFEQRLSEHFQVPKNQVVACTNATLGLMGAICTTEAKEYFAPVYTFPASLLALFHSGKQFRVLDVSKDDWEITEEFITNSAKVNAGVLRVIPFGAPVNFDKFADFGSVVIDAAASFGSEPSSLAMIPENTSVVYSFHATKVLGIGEGACVVFGSPQQAREFRNWINFGFNGDRVSLNLGINGKMSEYGAAIGLAALDVWEIEKSEWSNVQFQAQRISKILKIESITKNFIGISPYWIVEFESEMQANRATSRLYEASIGFRRWWGLGCHRMPAFAKHIVGNFPNTDLIAARSLGLPCFRDMSTSDFMLIREVLESL